MFLIMGILLSDIWIKLDVISYDLLESIHFKGLKKYVKLKILKTLIR